MNADKDGNKIAETIKDATVVSAHNRELAMRKVCATKASNPNPKARCPDCGFHVHGKGHVDGPHHNGRVARMTRN